MPGLKQNLDCPRRLVVFAVFDIIDRMGGEYEPAMAGDIRAKVKENQPVRLCGNRGDVRNIYSAHLAASVDGTADRRGKAAGAALSSGQRAVPH